VTTLITAAKETILIQVYLRFVAGVIQFFNSFVIYLTGGMFIRTWAIYTELLMITRNSANLLPQCFHHIESGKPV